MKHLFATILVFALPMMARGEYISVLDEPQAQVRLEKVLQRLMAEYDASQGTFLISPLRVYGNCPLFPVIDEPMRDDCLMEQPRVLWQEENLLFPAIFPPVQALHESHDSVYLYLRPKDILNLATDVVATSDEIAGSTYRVSQDWVDRELEKIERGSPMVLRAR